MILVQDIVNQCNALLDAEGSGRYSWDRDFKFAITSASQYVISIFNAAFAKNKLSEESLKELTYMKVWQTSLFSRFAFDSSVVGHSMWTILAIHPKISVIANNVTIFPVGSYPLSLATKESVYMPTLSFKDSNFSCKRLTSEEWTQRNTNPFVAGSPLISCADLREYGFIDWSNYTGGYSLTHDKAEIEISPDVAGELVAMRYLALPISPTVITDSLSYPDSLTNLITQLTMKFIGQKESGVSTFQISDQEIQQLAQILS